jgi:riboflavin synthase alpha subunit
VSVGGSNLPLGRLDVSVKSWGVTDQVGDGCLGQLEVGDKVNVERAMAAHTRFGGHMVQVSPGLASLTSTTPR